MAIDANASTSICPWSSFYRPSDLENSFNFFEPLDYLAARDSIESKDPITPEPKIFAWPKTTNTDALLPTPADCATHLQLLQCFLRLRFEVTSSTKLDDALGIEPRYRKVHVPQDYHQRKGRLTTTETVGSVPVRVKDPTYPFRRGDKWPFFVGLAASRFLAWFKVMEGRLSSLDETAESAFFLPPIDILMVWHALLLEQKSNLDLTVNGKKVFYMARIQFPWQEIHEAITVTSGNIYNFNPSASDIGSFEKDYSKLGPQDLLAYLESQATVKPPTDLSKALKSFGLPPNHISKDYPRSRGVSFADLPGVDDRALSTRDRAFLHSTLQAFKMDAAVAQLVGHVQRQMLFVDKMDFTNWLASPALEGTLKRAIERFPRFMKLFKFMKDLDSQQRQVILVTQRKVMLVPTLDIDLVWCTSRCSPDDYKWACKSLAGELINHNEHPKGENGWYGPKQNKPQMSSAYEYTSELYKVKYGAEYGICLCWECEALKSAMEAEDDGDFNEERDTKDIAQDVLVQCTRYRVAEKKRRAAAVKAWSDSHWPDGSTR